jgi:hypothetical protein
MSYYFCIIGTRDNPLFEVEFGTSKQGGDGVARFPAEAKQLNPFIVHASLDIVEEVQWFNNQMSVDLYSLMKNLGQLKKTPPKVSETSGSFFIFVHILLPDTGIRQIHDPPSTTSAKYKSTHSIDDAEPKHISTICAIYNHSATFVVTPRLDFVFI